MAGGAMKYRHLNRKSSHRQALLRNLVDSLFEHESISTTWPKAKEAQRLAEKLITLAKKNTEASRRRAHEIFYRPLQLVPKLFGPLRERYLSRPGGYTRVLHVEPLKEDQAPSAILELVDGPKDMRFNMTAGTLARLRAHNRDVNEITARNVLKVTQFRLDGENELEEAVKRYEEFAESGVTEEHFATLEESELTGKGLMAKRKVYLDTRDKETEDREKEEEKKEKERRRRRGIDRSAN